MSSFICNLDLQEIGLPTLFKWHRFTVDANTHKPWHNYNEYLGCYSLKIADSIYTQVSQNTSEILKELSNIEITFSVEKNQGKRYENKTKTPYIRCVFDKALLEFIKRIFISTIVYAAKDIPLPINEHETLEFLFDTEKKTVTITDIHVYEPDDPYYEYAKNAVYTLSVEAIGLGDYSMPDDDKIKDFYNWDNISSWKKRSFIFDDKANSALAGKAGIYMLYDSNSNEFYVGKAINLLERIKQHADNVDGNDPIPDFTHFRYSIINMEYYEFLYLIENAAIHDCAMILDMPKASKLNKPLVKIVEKSGKTLDKCSIVNTHERQRKKEVR